jgi:hypothetical protein
VDAATGASSAFTGAAGIGAISRRASVAIGFAGRDCCRAATMIPPAITRTTTMTVAFGPMADVKRGSPFPRTGLVTRVGFFEGIEALLW